MSVMTEWILIWNRFGEYWTKQWFIVTVQLSVSVLHSEKHVSSRRNQRTLLWTVWSLVCIAVRYLSHPHPSPSRCASEQLYEVTFSVSRISLVFGQPARFWDSSHWCSTNQENFEQNWAEILIDWIDRHERFSVREALLFQKSEQSIIPSTLNITYHISMHT